MIDFTGNWNDHLPLVEFLYNISCMSPFEALYGRMCRYIIGWFEMGEVSLNSIELAHEDIEKFDLFERG